MTKIYFVSTNRVTGKINSSKIRPQPETHKNIARIHSISQSKARQFYYMRQQLCQLIKNSFKISFSFGNWNILSKIKTLISGAKSC